MIVVNEVFGLHDYIMDICRRLAKLGYVAIAPGFFDRAGDPGAAGRHGGGHEDRRRRPPTSR